MKPLIDPAAFYGMPVYQDSRISKVNSDGEKILGFVVKDDKNPIKNCVLVHPDHWDEFVATINSGQRAGGITVGYGENADSNGSNKPKLP